MRLSEFLISTAMMSLTMTTAKAVMPPNLTEEARPEAVIDHSSDPNGELNLPLPPAPSPLIAEDKVLASAYYDTLSILGTSNRCSDFFGGTASVGIFNDLIGRVRKDYVSASIGMKMSGEIVDVFNASTRKAYRLFDNVSLNVNGPFYRRRVSRAEPSAPRMGSFEPNTREARVLIFLHELGHVVKGSDGKWLLPNDGDNEPLSRRNSDTIENICGDEINGLSTSEAAINLANRRKAEEKVTQPRLAKGPEF